MEAESLGRDLFSLATCHLPLVFIYTHIPYSQVRCSDYDSDGSHDLIGTFHTSLAQLQAVPVSASLLRGAEVGLEGCSPWRRRRVGQLHSRPG